MAGQHQQQRILGRRQRGQRTAQRLRRAALPGLAGVEHIAETRRNTFDHLIRRGADHHQVLADAAGFTGVEHPADHRHTDQFQTDFVGMLRTHTGAEAAGKHDRINDFFRHETFRELGAFYSLRANGV
ncbi:hypothetical protein SDC9_174686 [bioreactor metagenome]|uniref:Uncharacterized protein n=1 Tax=bioreactor metagenome TaxID=1076179 RepID=A0A645GM09_9ZZZZ